MSVEAAKKFFDEAKKNPLVKAQLENVADKDALATLAVNLGKKAGFDFSEEDAKAAIEQADGKLSDDQLGDLAGGLF